MDKSGREPNPLITVAEAGGFTPGLLGTVLARVARSAPKEISRREIAAGWPGTARPVDRRPILQPTVSKAVRQLAKYGLLAEGTRQKQGRNWVRHLRLGGGFVTATAHVMQKRSQPTGVTTLLCDIGGTRILAERTRMFTDSEASWELLARTIHQHVHLLTESDSTKSLFGVGVEVGAPTIGGVVTPITEATGTTGFSADLGGMLRRLFDHDPIPGTPSLAIVVENDVSCLTSLVYRDLGYRSTDLAVVAILDEGVGGGLIMDGLLRRGRSGRAMEVGHLIVDLPPGWRDDEPDTAHQRLVRTRWARLAEPVKCRCGLLGHVDAFSTPSSIRRDLGRHHEDDELPWTSLAAAVAATDAPHSSSVFACAGAAFGRGLAHVCNVADPGELVLFVPEGLVPPVPEPFAEFITCAEHELEESFAVRGRPSTTYQWRPLPPTRDALARLFGRAAAVRVLDTIIEQALQLDDDLDQLAS
ncbi:ROK family protein [Nocardia aurantia]|uniref:ROK family protein n=1 Tax=Nocardia aurantia TaxID=2585199 RepID=A0A7K0DMV8_9NOCA|nr:ROK family protein [Nocardia aurantia]MQY27080.1 hypothetical protein [Nocardia aurantia]